MKFFHHSISWSSSLPVRFYLGPIFVFLLTPKTICNYLFVFLFCLSFLLKLNAVKAEAVLVTFVHESLTQCLVHKRNSRNICWINIYYLFLLHSFSLLIISASSSLSFVIAQTLSPPTHTPTQSHGFSLYILLSHSFYCYNINCLNYLMFLNSWERNIDVSNSFFLGARPHL